VRHAEVSVPFLRERLKPIPALPPERLRALIAALDAKEFVAREKALKALGDLRRVAEPALQAALKNGPALEARRRIERLLAELGNREVAVRAGDGLRVLRAIQALEAVGTPAARAVLELLGEGAPEATETQDARAALGRLQGRGRKSP
jgi:hypothetical protein